MLVDRPDRTRDLRLPVAILGAVAIALIFWLGSRYPALDRKALMGAEAPVSGLALEAMLPILPDTGAALKFAMHFVNWLETNVRGMAFGLLFGAAALTVLPLVRRRSTGRPAADAALGALIGAPMGVCVNCVAPIAKGLYAGGASVATTLAATVASPTLNVVVISMSFALLPPYMAAIKLALVAVTILVLVPLIARGLPAPAGARVAPAMPRTARASLWARILMPPATRSEARPGLGGALGWFALTFARNLGYIAAVTVPIMLVAGAVGAAMVTLAPLDRWVGLFGRVFDGPWSAIAGLVLIAGFGLLLPAPIAFDVIVVAILMEAGLAPIFAAGLLIALGSYSLLAFIVLGQALSWRHASALGAAVLAVSVAGGLLSRIGDDRSRARHERLVMDQLAAARPTALAPGWRPEALTADAIARLPRAGAVAHGPLDAAITHEGAGRVEALAAPLAPAAPEQGPAFRRRAGSQIGLGDVVGLTDLLAFDRNAPFSSIASGDVDGDGWTDLAMNAPPEIGGVSLYVNLGGRFVRQALDLGPVSDMRVGPVALRDMDGDGDVDLVLSAWGGGTHVLLNEGGAFDWGRRIEVPHGAAPVLGTLAFADFDADGDLDIGAGAWTGGTSIGGLRAKSNARDMILWNEGGAFRAMPLPGSPQQALTSLAWDADRDGDLDLLIGDDFGHTDKLHLNLGGGAFRMARRADGLVPHLPRTTMSYDVGDFDDDGIAELYGAQIARPPQEARASRRALCERLAADGDVLGVGLDGCMAELTELQLAFRLVRLEDAESCAARGAAGRGACIVHSAIQRSLRDGDAGRCALVSEEWRGARADCEQGAVADVTEAERRADELAMLPGAPAEWNVLLDDAPGQPGLPRDLAGPSGAGQPGWSWSSRFADLDQDGRLDIFVGTGWLRQPGRFDNAFLRNAGDGTFARAEEEFGLADPLPTTSYALIDFDRDGDVDIVRPPVVGEVVVHESVRAAGGAIWVRLEDGVGNTEGIGATVWLDTPSGRRMRLVKASGGFLTQDRAQAHFGLGAAPAATGIAVRWPDGATTRIEGRIEAGREIVLRREPG